SRARIDAGVLRRSQEVSRLVPGGGGFEMGAWRLLIILGICLCAPAALAAPPADTDAYIARAMQTFGVPGLSLAIVENGKTVIAKGYGVTEVGKTKLVDAHSAFPIGSESKAFTSAALAILVDRKKLKWEDRVKDRLPGFQMYD